MEQEHDNKKEFKFNISILRLTFNVLLLAVLYWPVYNLAKVIFKHEGIGDVLLGIDLILLTVLIGAFFVFISVLIIMKNKVKSFHDLMEEKAKSFTALAGFMLACIFLAFNYANFSSIFETKELTIASLNKEMFDYANKASSEIVSGIPQGVGSQIDESLTLESNNNVTLKMKESTIQNFMPPNKEASYINYADFELRKNDSKAGIKGGAIFNREDSLEASLGESSPVLAYLKKDDFSRSAMLRIHTIALVDEPGEKCFVLKYRLMFNHKSPEIGEREFCKKNNAIENDKLFLYYSYPEKLKSMEVWVINQKNSTAYTNQNNPISHISASEDQSIKNYFITQGCIEGFNEGMPSEKYKAIIGFVPEGSFITNKQVEVEPGQCLSKDFK